MNFELAILALEGLARSPLKIEFTESGATIQGTGASFRELARLCLLLGSDGTDDGETLDLQSNVHLAAGSVGLRLLRTAASETR